MISPTFSLPPTQNNLQFIPYNGPPKLKLTPQNGHQSGGFEELVSMRTSRGASDESLGQPAPSIGSSEENAAVIEDSQPGPEINTDGKGCPLENDIGAQTHDRLEIPGISTSDLHGRECSTGMEDAIKYGVVGKLEPQANRLPRRESTSTPSTPPNGSSMIKIEQSTQEASGHALPKATLHQPQRPMHKAKGQGKFPIFVKMSSSSSNGSDDDDSGNHTISLKRKRKCSPPAKPHSRTSNTTSKQRSKHPAHSYRSRRHKRERNRGGADEDDEYEVEKILDARDYRAKLQYRVKWVGYKHDPRWYDASNFKNSPYKLRDFHTANPSRPGPPRRLRVWVQCWEDADDHPDDNKP